MFTEYNIIKSDNNAFEKYLRGDFVSGNVIFMPDIEYRAWVNGNKELLDEIIKTGKVSTLWLCKGNNKKFLVRYFGECGYTISIDD